ncbi:hypothetical protein [Flavobacterium sp. fv08]|uniref:hypothetical protein n=1 Tax=Flavobacterium sp. fv08 TaxID=1761784 RepID=UPI0008C2F6A1|nr:hypothetical protein [Flavobacterium sp. fv08]SEP06710.1 hypothetical protein SAMN04487978_4370 [Flavobacterium sp. fv08]
MKILTFKYLAPFYLLLCTSITFAQDGKPGAPTPLKNPLDQTAFHKNIMQDLNFMVLGDNNTKQGFSYEYDEKKTELSLSGALISNRYFLTTIDGSFAVDEGAFIFDNKDGSKKGSININFFAPLPFWNGKYFPAATGDRDSGKANRARFLNYQATVDLPKKVADTFNILNQILEDLKLPTSKIVEPSKAIFRRNVDRVYEQQTLGFLPNENNKAIIDQGELLKTAQKYYKNSNGVTTYSTYDNLLAAIRLEQKENYVINGKNGTPVKVDVPKGLDIEKLFEDYDKILTRAENIKEEVSDKQIKRFKDMWTIEYNTYLGISGYYERESMDLYQNDNAIQNFNDRFIDNKGDLYGAKASFNHVARWKSGTFIMFRALAGFGRGSNFKDFDKKDFVYSSNPETVGTGTMVEEKKKTGYYTENGSPYDYGFLQKYSTELYASLKVVGVYAKFGYSKNEALIKKETLPFETGIMLNVNSEKKSVVSILLFVSREDLNVHPDLDTNFGFKIGLPINIRKSEKDKEKEEEKS